MKRSVQGFCIILGSAIATVTVLAAAVAWGPHHCKIAFPMVIGCAIANYESLAGGIVAASAALFAGWLAWSAVQVQIAAQEKRASAERHEVETVLQADLDYLAEGLSSIWKILLAIDTEPRATVAQLEAIFGWQGGAMASLYTRAADRRRLALEGMHMLANNDRTSIAAPSEKVRRKTRKD